MSPSILNTFLTGDEVQELAPTPSRVGQVLQYHLDRLPPHYFTIDRLGVCIVHNSLRK